MSEQSVNLRTYLFLEKIYLEADDESKDETDAHGLMGIVLNFLTDAERKFIHSRGVDAVSETKDLEDAALSHGIQEGAQMSRFLLWVGNECFEGREVQNLMVLTARAKELVQMFLAQDRKDHCGDEGVVGKSVGMKVGLSVSVAGGPQRCAKCGEEDHDTRDCRKPR